MKLFDKTFWRMFRGFVLIVVGAIIVLYTTMYFSSSRDQAASPSSAAQGLEAARAELESFEE